MWIALVFCVIAAVCDRLTYRIPNGLTCTGMAVGILLNAVGGFSTAADALLGLLLPVFILWLPYRQRMLGAGDLKLLGMCGAFAGSRKSLEILLFSFAAGAILAIAAMVHRKNAGKRFAFLAEYIGNGLRTGTWPPYLRKEDTDARIHFACAVLLGQLTACLRLLI